MNRPQIYLAGPVMHDQEHGTDWREAVKANFPGVARWRDPTDYIGTEEVLSGEASPRLVVETDKELLAECDGVLVGLTRARTIGTWREVEYAKTVLHLPIAFWWAPRGSRGELIEDELSLWIREAGPVYHSFEDVMEYLDGQIYGGPDDV